MPHSSKRTVPSTSKRVYTRLTLGQITMCKLYNKHPCSVADLIDWAVRAFDLPKVPSQNAVYEMLRNQDKLFKLPKENYTYKKVADPVKDAFDRALFHNFDMMEDELTVTDEALLFRAINFFLPVPLQKRPGFSKGWLHRFKKRHGICSRRKHVEVVFVTPASMVEGRDKMRKLTDFYDLSDIYNMDETSFYYLAEPPWTLTRRNKVSGRKANKTRLTLAVATNADGCDKLPLLFIGKSENPPAFKGHDVSTELCVEYTNSKKAWMNSTIFLRWLHALDLRMRRENRRVLLLVDNVSSHVRPLAPLTNVRLEFLPKNTTSVLQPLDQGIIHSVKRGFSRIKIQHSVRRFSQRLPQEKISIFTALSWAKQAWDGVTAEFIENCWVHSGIIPRSNSALSMRAIICH